MICGELHNVMWCRACSFYSIAKHPVKGNKVCVWLKSCFRWFFFHFRLLSGRGLSSLTGHLTRLNCFLLRADQFDYCGFAVVLTKEIEKQSKPVDNFICCSSCSSCSRTKMRANWSNPIIFFKKNRLTWDTFKQVDFITQLTSVN